MDAPAYNNLASPAPGRHEDMFLALSLAGSGPVAGESEKQGHLDEIEIDGWSWSMQAASSLGSGGSAGKATVGELRLRKPFDKSSTALLQALRHNQPVTKAVLSVRKAGGKPHDYLTVCVEEARLTTYEVDTDGPRPLERITLSFRRIKVEYRPQRADGLPGGGAVYIDQIV